MDFWHFNEGFNFFVSNFRRYFRKMVFKVNFALIMIVITCVLLSLVILTTADPIFADRAVKASNYVGHIGANLWQCEEITDEALCARWGSGRCKCGTICLNKVCQCVPCNG